MTADGAPVERLLDVDFRPLLERLPARPPGAGQGPAGAAPRAPRPARRRDLAAARQRPPRVLARARPAQRAARAHPRRARLATPRSAPGTASSRVAALALREHRADGRRAARRAVRAARRAARPERRRRRSSTGPRSRAADEDEFVAELQARLPSRPRARASPDTARTATSWRCCATAASCALTARRASSASRCWRCCSPSARCSPRAPAHAADAARRRDERARRRAPRAARRASSPATGRA